MSIVADKGSAYRHGNKFLVTARNILVVAQFSSCFTHVYGGGSQIAGEALEIGSQFE